MTIKSMVMIKWSRNTTRWCNTTWSSVEFTTKCFKDFISKVTGQLVRGSQQVRFRWLMRINGHNILAGNHRLIGVLALPPNSLSKFWSPLSEPVTLWSRVIKQKMLVKQCWWWLDLLIFLNSKNVIFEHWWSGKYTSRTCMMLHH